MPAFLWVTWGEHHRAPRALSRPRRFVQDPGWLPPRVFYAGRAGCSWSPCLQEAWPSWQPAPPPASTGRPTHRPVERSSRKHPPASFLEPTGQNPQRPLCFLGSLARSDGPKTTPVLSFAWPVPDPPRWGPLAPNAGPQFSLQSR